MSAESTSNSSESAPKRKVKVRFGVSEREIDLAPNTTVKEYRDRLKAVMNIPEGAKAFSGNTELSDDAIVAGKDGETPVIEFIKKTGEKG